MTKRAIPRPTINIGIMLPPLSACSLQDKTKAQILSVPGLQNQNSVRIPMAFTAQSQRVRCGRVPIAFSDILHRAGSARMGLLVNTLVVGRFQLYGPCISLY